MTRKQTTLILLWYLLLMSLAAVGWQQQVTAQTETAVYLPIILCPTCETAVPPTCPSANFIQVMPHPANSEYPNPELTVTCTADTFVIESNGIPNFEFVQVTPSELQAQDYLWELPLEPTWLDSPMNIPLGGPVAVAVNGLPIFGPNEAPQANYGDAYLDGLLDFCNGHVAQNGDYHFHSRPECLFTDTAGTPYLVLGYAFDGYPILSPTICEDAACTTTYEVQSSWQEVGDGYQPGDNTWEAHQYMPGSGDLDQCNGMTLTDGSYAYFATDTFPYFLGCYHGQVNLPPPPPPGN